MTDDIMTDDDIAGIEALKRRDEEQVAAIIRGHVLGSIEYPW
jgi:hypothetical protein